MGGTKRTFQIDMSRVDGTYADEQVFDNWKFGPPGYEVPLQVSESDSTEAGSITIQRDVIYIITVASDSVASKIYAYISDEQPIDTGDFAM
jgi:C-terminal processing protease CtpA/Prc